MQSQKKKYVIASAVGLGAGCICYCLWKKYKNSIYMGPYPIQMLKENDKILLKIDQTQLLQKAFLSEIQLNILHVPLKASSKKSHSKEEKQLNEKQVLLLNYLNEVYTIFLKLIESHKTQVELEVKEEELKASNLLEIIISILELLLQSSNTYHELLKTFWLEKVKRNLKHSCEDKFFNQTNEEFSGCSCSNLELLIRYFELLSNKKAVLGFLDHFAKVNPEFQLELGTALLSQSYHWSECDIEQSPILLLNDIMFKTRVLVDQIATSYQLVSNLLEMFKDSHQKGENRKFNEYRKFFIQLYSYPEIFTIDVLRFNYILAIITILQESETSLYLDLSDPIEGATQIMNNYEEIMHQMSKVQLVKDLEPCLTYNLDLQHKVCKEIGNSLSHFIKKAINIRNNNQGFHELNLNLLLASVHINAIIGNQNELLAFYENYLNLKSESELTEYLVSCAKRIKQFFMNSPFFTKQMIQVSEVKYNEILGAYQQFYHPLCTFGYQLALWKKESATTLMKEVSSKLIDVLGNADLYQIYYQNELQFLLNMIEDQLSFLKITTNSPEYIQFREEAYLKLCVNYLQIQDQVEENKLVEFANSQIRLNSNDKTQEILNQITTKTVKGSLVLNDVFKAKLFQSLFSFDTKLYEQINAKTYSLNQANEKENYHQECLIDNENDQGILLNFILQIRNNVLTHPTFAYVFVESITKNEQLLNSLKRYVVRFIQYFQDSAEILLEKESKVQKISKQLQVLLQNFILNDELFERMKKIKDLVYKKAIGDLIIRDLIIKGDLQEQFGNKQVEELFKENE